MLTRVVSLPRPAAGRANESPDEGVSGFVGCSREGLSGSQGCDAAERVLLEKLSAAGTPFSASHGLGGEVRQRCCRGGCTHLDRHAPIPVLRARAEGP